MQSRVELIATQLTLLTQRNLQRHIVCFMYVRTYVRTYVVWWSPQCSALYLADSVTITYCALPQYPVLTLGDGLGSRVVLQEGNSTHSGRYVVEECTEGEERVRRLVFLDTPHLAQTEMRLTGERKSCNALIEQQSYCQTVYVCVHVYTCCFTAFKTVIQSNLYLDYCHTVKLTDCMTVPVCSLWREVHNVWQNATQCKNMKCTRSVQQSPSLFHVTAFIMIFHCVGKPSTSKRSKKNSPSLKPDHTHLLFDFHKVVIATLALVRDIITGGREVKGLLVGLGGGALPMYLGRLLNRVRLVILRNIYNFFKWNLEGPQLFNWSYSYRERYKEGFNLVECQKRLIVNPPQLLVYFEPLTYSQSVISLLTRYCITSLSQSLGTHSISACPTPHTHTRTHTHTHTYTHRHKHAHTHTHSCHWMWWSWIRRCSQLQRSGLVSMRVREWECISVMAYSSWETRLRRRVSVPWHEYTC